MAICKIHFAFVKVKSSCKTSNVNEGDLHESEPVGETHLDITVLFKDSTRISIAICIKNNKNLQLALTFVQIIILLVIMISICVIIFTSIRSQPRPENEGKLMVAIHFQE